VHPPDLGDLVTVSRMTRVGRVALTIAGVAASGGVAFAVAAVAAPAAVRWGTAAILLVLLAATWLLCAHAGGLAWFVPLPAFALAAVWAFTASAHSPVCRLVAGRPECHRQRRRGVHRQHRLAPTPPGVAGRPPTREGCHRRRRDGPDSRGDRSGGGRDVERRIRQRDAAGRCSGARDQGPAARLEVWSEVGSVPDVNIFDIEEDQS
jgi:hypothetical protein